MGSFRVRRGWPPASSLEGRRADKLFVDGEQTLAYAVGNLIEIACAQLVRYKTLCERC